MPTAELAQYGIGVFAVAALVYLAVTKWPTDRPKKSDDTNQHLVTVVENNTKAISDNTNAISNLNTIMQVSLARHEVKLDEILKRVSE